MSLRFSYDFNQLPSVQDLFIGWLFGAGMTYLMRKFKISIKLDDIRNNCNWIRIIFFHGFSFMFLASLEGFFDKIKLKPISKLCYKLNIQNFKSGLKFVDKKYPNLLYGAFKLLEKFSLQQKLEKITGIKFDPSSLV